LGLPPREGRCRRAIAGIAALGVPPSCRYRGVPIVDAARALPSGSWIPQDEHSRLCLLAVVWRRGRYTCSYCRFRGTRTVITSSLTSRSVSSVFVVLGFVCGVTIVVIFAFVARATRRSSFRRREPRAKRCSWSDSQSPRNREDSRWKPSARGSFVLDRRRDTDAACLGDKTLLLLLLLLLLLANSLGRRVRSVLCRARGYGYGSPKRLGK